MDKFALREVPTGRYLGRDEVSCTDDPRMARTFRTREETTFIRERLGLLTYSIARFPTTRTLP